MATETGNFDCGLSDEHKDGCIAACFTHNTLLCLKCKESHGELCKVKSLEGTLYEKDKGLIQIMGALQKAKRSFTETEKYLQEIRERRQAVKDDINLELKDIIIRLEQSAKLAIQTVDSEAVKMESTFTAFLKEGRELETKLKDHLSMNVGLEKFESVVQALTDLLKKTDTTRSGKSLDASFNVNETLRHNVNHKPFGTVIFSEVECYEDVLPHTKPKRTQTKTHNSRGEVVPQNQEADEESASDSDIYYESQFGTESSTLPPDLKGRKRSLIPFIGKNNRVAKNPVVNGSPKPKMFDGTLKPKMIASFAKFKQIFKKTEREVESSIFFSDDPVCSENATTTSPVPSDSKTVVVFTPFGQEKQVPFSWTADFTNGIIYFNNTEKKLLLTDADRKLKCSEYVQDEPLAILHVSMERVAMFCIIQKSGSCVLRCYDVHDREIRLYHSVKLPDEFSQQFIGAWYDTVDDRFAVACSDKLFILNRDGAIESEHELEKSADEPVDADRNSSDAKPVKNGGERDILEATYDFRNRLLFVPDAKQGTCEYYITLKNENKS
ncbi:uncharacterized protein LOC127870088 [Dreissena polymorpha]|uniref:Uncharacterized protein n=1 Tax=Dreissena polymorpha TaxID=45954 RepID=A0A9D4MCA0_DREPO|nr:uncharacterized protein LOC127870088 [Dreissena polymorpha]KAH3873621.1 hypothetical protein DPMN_036859 [Dreissena polymorpha]